MRGRSKRRAFPGVSCVSRQGLACRTRKVPCRTMIGPHSVRSRVTLGGSDDWIPVWSPDGAQVFFMSYRNGVGDIYAKSVGGSTLEQPVVLSTSQKVPTDISSDGRYVAYWSESTETLGDV